MLNSGNIVQDAALLGKAQAFGATKKPQTEAEMDKTAKSFESMFLSQMMEHMFEGVGEDSVSGNQYGDDVYRGWMVEQYARLITDKGGIGIASQVKQELIKLQEISSGGANGALPAIQPTKEAL